MKKRTKQKDGYFVKSQIPRFDDGDSIFTNFINNPKSADYVNQGSQLASAGVNMFQPVNGDTNAGLSAASGALTGLGEGAKLGSAFGPYGTVIGAGVGLVGGAVSGLVSGGKKHAAYERQQVQATQGNFFNTRNNMQQVNSDMYGGNYADGDEVKKAPIYSPRDYTIAYTNSKVYKDRLAQTGGGTKPQSVDNLASTQVTQDSNKESGAIYNNSIHSTNRLNINTNQLNKLGATLDEGYAHEWSHLARKLSSGEQNTIFNLNKSKDATNLRNIYNPSIYNNKNIVQHVNDEPIYHDIMPSESKADLDALRYQMYKKGIYDTSKGNMDEATMNKALADPEIKNSFITKRLLQNFDPKSLIQMNNTIASTGDTDNTNNSMNSQRYAQGDQVTDGDNVNTQDDPQFQAQRVSPTQGQPTMINIEKGELRIDADKGKILQEYKGINPMTGGLYQSHSKDGKDPIHNITKANEGDFIITKKRAKQYKDAVDNNDKIAKDTILMNIRNNKVANQGGLSKYADGSDILPYGSSFGVLSNENTLANTTNVKPYQLSTPNISSTTTPNYTHQDNVGDMISKYGPSAFNIGQGLFGKVNTQPQGTPISNPYLANIQANMPKNISYDPLINGANEQANAATKDLQNRTNSSAVYRANRQSILSNTQKNIAGIKLQAAEANNNVSRQRAGIYENLGDQSVRDQEQLRSFNYEVNNSNNRALAAKQNYLNTGLSQLQQTYQNDKTNSQKENMDRYQIELMKQIYPSINPYGQFDPNYVFRQKYQ